uniref:Uncharacterized protein n=2 Tax=Anopheles atroparvus TaxID=41427 RepID=A0AAG5DW74_ANOAO
MTSKPRSSTSSIEGSGGGKPGGSLEQLDLGMLAADTSLPSHSSNREETYNADETMVASGLQNENGQSGSAELQRGRGPNLQLQREMEAFGMGEKADRKMRPATKLRPRKNSTLQVRRPYAKQIAKKTIPGKSGRSSSVGSTNIANKRTPTPGGVTGEKKEEGAAGGSLEQLDLGMPAADTSLPSHSSNREETNNADETMVASGLQNENGQSGSAELQRGRGPNLQLQREMEAFGMGEKADRKMRPATKLRPRKNSTLQVRRPYAKQIAKKTIPGKSGRSSSVGSTNIANKRTPTPGGVTGEKKEEGAAGGSLEQLDLGMPAADTSLPSHSSNREETNNADETMVASGLQNENGQSGSAELQRGRGPNLQLQREM